MRGCWRTIKGRLLPLPMGLWLALEIRHTTVVNVNGQVLCLLDGKRWNQSDQTSHLIGLAS